MSERKNLINRLADVGEDAIQRFADVPGADRVRSSIGQLTGRMDELQRRVLGVESLERRVERLERRLDRLSPQDAEVEEDRANPETQSRSGEAAASEPGPEDDLDLSDAAARTRQAVMGSAAAAERGASEEGSEPEPRP